jgi:hypothetical protein
VWEWLHSAPVTAPLLNTSGRYLRLRRHVQALRLNASGVSVDVSSESLRHYGKNQFFANWVETSVAQPLVQIPLCLSRQTKNQKRPRTISIKLPLNMPKNMPQESRDLPICSVLYHSSDTEDRARPCEVLVLTPDGIENLSGGRASDDS